MGIRKNLVQKEYCFKFPPETPKNCQLKELLIDQNPDFLFKNNTKEWDTFMKYLNNKYNKNKFDLKKIMSQDYLILDTRQSDLRLYKNSCPTLRTGRHGIMYIRNNQIRKLSGREALLLQGFTTKEIANLISISNHKLLSQAGNAFTINVITAIIQMLLEDLNDKKNKNF